MFEPVVMTGRIQFSGLYQIFTVKPHPCYTGRTSFRNELLDLPCLVRFLFRLTLTNHAVIRVSICIHEVPCKIDMAFKC